MEFHTILGSIGVTLLLTAYILSLYNKLTTQSLGYMLLNFIGASLAMWSSYLIDFIPFVILEGTWALVSLKSLLKSRKPQNT
ncbi:hypothetical protein [uncultured Dokdonia sp.]|uniref:CBU_0592 family membrane protein n=1 Tax=uncultured Dokdonia sp. TaxID=575653 RepID=UPI00262B4607|nr:hypothetical protein [uncultured Dokdonia sp.]